jgi:hypothetical protein
MEIRKACAGEFLITLIIHAKMAAHGLNPEELMKDGSLIFDRDTEKDLLLFLNEDLWTGDFSGDQYAAARKARR